MAHAVVGKLLCKSKSVTKLFGKKITWLQLQATDATDLKK